MTINDKEFLDWITSITPSKRQLDWQAMGYYNFIHFGMNTFTGKEWGNGKASPKMFNPKNLDTDQWCKAFKDSGSTGVLLTAKHHDGFCLFPSKYTDYTIANSPYKNGKGDIVGELAASCKKYGLKFGVYLSPWDRHESTYGTDAYNDFYCNQLEELMTNYGELFCLWFDGACGEGPNGKKQEYDWKRYYDTIRKHQPNAVISISGPDVRWIGNEHGEARKAEWSVQSSRMSDYNEIKSNFQQTDDGDFMKSGGMPEAITTLGSRENLFGEKGLIWYPAEMDVSITTKCWFWRRSAELFHLRSVKNLMQLYNTSVGSNATLLLNVPVDRSGLVPKRFVNRLAQFGEALKMAYSMPKKCTITDNGVKNGVYEYTIETDETHVKVIELAEDVTKSQRIEKFELYAFDGAEYNLIYAGETVGYKKFCIIDGGVDTSSIKLRITSSRNEPYLLNPILY